MQQHLHDSVKLKKAKAKKNAQHIHQFKRMGNDDDEAYAVVVGGDEDVE